jgi:hypothetical protein
MITSPIQALIRSTLVVSSLSLGIGVADAQEVTKGAVLKPLQGVSFDIGSKRAVAYFTTEREMCRVVLTMADEPNWENAGTFSALRFESSVSPGKSGQYKSAGHIVEFSCGLQAHTLSITTSENIAGASAE